MSYRREALVREGKDISYILRFDINPLWDESVEIVNRLILDAAELSDTEIIACLKSLQYPKHVRGQAPVSPIVFEALEHFRDRMLAQWLNHPFIRDVIYETYFVVQRASYEMYRPEDVMVELEMKKLLEELRKQIDELELVEAKVRLLLSKLTDFFNLEALATNAFAAKALNQLNRAEVELLMAEADL